VDACPICHQPECPSSSGGARHPAGDSPSKLSPGQREYRGYEDWAVHPQDAVQLLHRGSVTLNGRPAHVQWIHNEAFVTQIAVIPQETNAAP